MELLKLSLSSRSRRGQLNLRKPNSNTRRASRLRGFRGNFVSDFMGTGYNNGLSRNRPAFGGRYFVSSPIRTGIPTSE